MTLMTVIWTFDVTFPHRYLNDGSAVWLIFGWLFWAQVHFHVAAVRRYVKTLAEVVSCCYCCSKIALPGRDKVIVATTPSSYLPITQPESGDNKGQFYWLLGDGCVKAVSLSESLIWPTFLLCRTCIQYSKLYVLIDSFNLESSIISC